MVNKVVYWKELWNCNYRYTIKFYLKIKPRRSRWLLYTCLPTANPSPASLAVATCDRPTVVISISHVWNLLRTEDVHLHTPALRIGYHFLHLRDSSLSLSSFKHHLKTFLFSFYYRLAHAARLGFFYKKTRYINSLLLFKKTKLKVAYSTEHGREWCLQS